ncbi:hypothetical protein ONZ45_g8229 [Pleurotus djamor]|nr:hypothetical protein ONZ45_g8229 [Pleurotus djamor]
MIFSRILSVFAFALTFSLVATAKPIAEAEGSLVKRADADTADVESVFLTLKSSTDSILPEIESLVDSGNANAGNLGDLFGQLTSAISTADTNLNTLKGKPPTGKPGPSKDVLAKLIAGIIIAIVKTVSKVLVKAGLLLLPTVTLLIISLDVALHGLLVTVGFLLTGILAIVAGLVFDVAGLLSSIGFTLVFALLKLSGGW